MKKQHKNNWVKIFFAIFFVWFTYKNTEVEMGSNNYQLFARFENISGINQGSEVRIAGVKVGSVVNKSIDPKSYMAVVRVAIKFGIDIPSDSSIAIVSDGLLGSKYINITPGSDDTMLKSGGEIAFTQSSVNLETLIGKMIFSSNEKK